MQAVAIYAHMAGQRVFWVNRSSCVYKKHMFVEAVEGAISAGQHHTIGDRLCILSASTLKERFGFTMLHVV